MQDGVRDTWRGGAYCAFRGDERLHCDPAPGACSGGLNAAAIPVAVSSEHGAMRAAVVAGYDPSGVSACFAGCGLDTD